ncbi:hypothetical protein MCOR25_001847 [Pyricularia grisea]|nr:hypothetical protein MCOR25_001847 [Pyricularia grisea]
MLPPESNTSMMLALVASEAIKASKRNSIEESPGKQDAVAVQPTTKDGPNDGMVTPLHQESDTGGSSTLSPRDNADKMQPNTPQSSHYSTEEIDSLDGAELPALDPDTPGEAGDYVEALALSSDPSQMPPRAATVQDRERSWARPDDLGLSDPFVQPVNMAATLV